MSKMTMKIIEDLYECGKKVYHNDIDLNDAVNLILSKYGSDISLLSTRFYIGLYSDYINGKYVTWNQNSNLVLFYVEHIMLENNDDIGRNAFQAGMYFAKSKSKRDLIEKLDEIWKKLTGTDSPLVVMPEMQSSHLIENNSLDLDIMDDIPSVQEAIGVIKSYIAARGFNYPDGLIENFYLCLKTKPFVILAGTSGTGKTRLVRLFAEAIGAGYWMVPVRPDWSDGSDLFGHRDLNGNFVAGPACACFEEAYGNPDRPVILCLDEMNLARVEHYLSDFLSAVESREWRGGGIATCGIAQYAQGIPDNLYVVGTVNMDETTFPFSRKVLDRANTIEFSHVDLMPDFDGAGGDPEPVALPNSFLRAERLVLARDCAGERDAVNGICETLQDLNGILAKADAHVGYRVRDEIVFYVLANREAGLLPDDRAMDNQVMQKILPRIQGSSAAVKALLTDLFRFCAGKDDADGDAGAVVDRMRSAAASARYPASAGKIAAMTARLEEDGFASYWL